MESLFSFICSSCNSIPRITSMVDKLCRSYGDRVATIEGEDYFAFPTVERLAAEGVEASLREEAFGYRAGYIAQTAKQLVESTGVPRLYELRHQDHAVAKAYLQELPGVGPKVADCVCLMSLDKHSAIPVDTHVWQYAVRDYKFGGAAAKTKGMTKKQYDEIGDLFRGLHGSHAGWAQSVLFLAALKKFKDPAPAVEMGVIIEEEVNKESPSPSSSKKRATPTDPKQEKGGEKKKKKRC